MGADGSRRKTSSRRTLVLGGLGATAVVVAGGVRLASRSGVIEDLERPVSPDGEAVAGVAFTTTGASFSPVLELDAGSGTEVVWLDTTGIELARGASPTIGFGSPGTHTVVLRTNYQHVLTVNLGFSSEDDAGRYSLDARYNKPAEQVSRISGLTRLTNLRRFLAARGPLAGPLALTGLSSLEHIECFGARVDSVDLTGCTSLVRLCLEENNLSVLDLNPVSASLRDLRAAAQRDGALAFTGLTSPLARVYHFCVRDQTVTGHPTADQLPACEELWNWNTSQTGSLPTPGMARSVMAAGNAYSSADLSGQWQYEGGWGLVDLTGNQLTDLDLSGCTSLQTIQIGDNALDEAAVDSILGEVASWGTSGFALILDGSNSAPGRAGMTAVAELRARGWRAHVTAADR